MSFLHLQDTLYKELATIHLNIVDEGKLPKFARGRTWCALNLIGHAAKIFIKPIVYLIAALAKLVLSLYKVLRGNRSLPDLQQSGQFFVCAPFAPFTEAINVCKAALGIIIPKLYYRPLINSAIRFDAKYLGVARLDATYDTNGEGNLDYSYVNPKLGFGFVIDGAGHGNPERKKIQDPIIRGFIENYQKELRESTFNTIEGAQQFVQKQMDAFGKKFNEVLADYAPAIMFTQVIQIGNKRYLFMAHMADAALYIKKQNGWWMAPTQKDIGFGSDGIRGGEINLPKVQILEVAIGDELIGFTDGIGEFLTKSECYDIINSNNDRRTLLQEFKLKIIEKGNERAETVGRGGSESGEAASGGKAIKFHNPDPMNKQDHDDISLFSLVVE
jgi:hypothetical protein